MSYEQTLEKTLRVAIAGALPEEHVASAMEAQAIAAMDEAFIGELLADSVYQNNVVDVTPPTPEDADTIIGSTVRYIVARIINEISTDAQKPYLIASPMIVSLLQVSPDVMYEMATVNDWSGPNNAALVGRLDLTDTGRGKVRVFSYLMNTVNTTLTNEQQSENREAIAEQLANRDDLSQLTTPHVNKVDTVLIGSGEVTGVLRSVKQLRIDLSGLLGA
jgi:hypothetical protein